MGHPMNTNPAKAQISKSIRYPPIITSITTIVIIQTKTSTIHRTHLLRQPSISIVKKHTHLYMHLLTTMTVTIDMYTSPLACMTERPRSTTIPMITIPGTVNTTMKN